jgi:hypothetical protein
VKKPCIICLNKSESLSIEHIVPESMGNSIYILEGGTVCDQCNNRFSKFEDKAISNSIFHMERARFGFKTKKGKAPRGKIDKLSITGDQDFRKNIINIKGLDSENFQDFDPKTGRGRLLVRSFDKSEVATSKLLLKMGIESIFKSKPEVYNTSDFTDLRNFLTSKETNDWPFITANKKQPNFQDILSYTLKRKFKIKRIAIKYCELNLDSLLFLFSFGSVIMIINLLNRNLHWIRNIKSSQAIVSVYPEYFETRIKYINQQIT